MKLKDYLRDHIQSETAAATLADDILAASDFPLDAQSWEEIAEYLGNRSVPSAYIDEMKKLWDHFNRTSR